MRRKVAYTSRLKEGSPAEEAAESPKVEAAEGAQVGAGGKPGAAGGERAGHPQNLAEPTRAGSGQGALGGRAVASPIDKVEPGSADVVQPNPVSKKKAAKAPAKAAKGSNRLSAGAAKNLGHFLGKVARGTGRPN